MEAAASAAVTMVPIRAAYSFEGTHSDTYYDETAISYGIDFFDITLRGGAAAIDPADQVWHGRAACGLIGLVSALVAFVALALTLLRAPFFATLVRPEPKSITTCDTPAHGLRYALIYLVCLLPAPCSTTGWWATPTTCSPSGSSSSPSSGPTRYSTWPR